MRTFKICILLAILAVPLSASSAFAETQYDKIFPLYVQSCSLSRVKKVGRSAGAPWGHAVVYVKGMCRDKTAPYPRVEVCGDEMDLTNPNSGTLVSVEPGFKNTNWIAIEGGNLAFSGDLQPGGAVNTEAMNRTMKTALDSGMFRGISMHKRWRSQKLPGMTDEENVAKITLGTHYAIDFGRTSFCNLIPINQEQVKSIVKYLNQVNQPYVEGKKSYRWDAFTDNCVHLVRNVLAAANISSYQPVGRHFPLGFFDMLLPGDHFVKLVKQGTRLDELTETKVYKNKLKRKCLNNFGTPSICHGMITRIQPMRSENNDYFIPSDDMLLEVFRSRKVFLHNVLTVEAKKNLLENLIQYEAKYLDLRTQLKPIAEMATQKRLYSKPKFQAFHDQYVRWLDSALIDIRLELNQMRNDSNLEPVKPPIPPYALAE